MACRRAVGRQQVGELAQDHARHTINMQRKHSQHRGLGHPEGRKDQSKV